MMKL
ncbi:cuticular protein RR-1 motif 7 precursor, partial [Danaus plexippus plexippus]|jgi:hypothetical protein